MHYTVKYTKVHSYKLYCSLWPVSRKVRQAGTTFGALFSKEPGSGEETRQGNNVLAAKPDTWAHRVEENQLPRVVL